MELDASDIVECISKMRAYNNNAKICLTSVNGEHQARRRAAAMSNKYEVMEYHEHIKCMGVTIIPSDEIETDHAFFFATVEDSQEFLKSIRELKDAGMEWTDIVRWFECHMRQVWK